MVPALPTNVVVSVMKLHLIYLSEIIKYIYLISLIGVCLLYPSESRKSSIGLRKFYKEVLPDQAILDSLSKMNVTREEIDEANNLISELIAAQTLFEQRMGDAQNTTKVKDAAMRKNRKWMSTFYKTARIALKDQPQLLEALGKVVKD